MRTLVPVKIRINRKLGKGGNQINDYPDLNQIDVTIRRNLDWSVYLDSKGVGMHYSRNGFGEGDDPNTQWAGTCVPEDFAAAAIALFPNRVMAMSEAEWLEFYENDCCADVPAEEVDVELLQALAAKKALGIPFSTEDNEAIDPAHPRRGIRKNWRKKWADASDRWKVSLKSIK